MLDLDGDGFGLEWRNGNSPDFDIDLDLFAESTATLDRDDGYLARVINGDGVINDASELFGHGNVLGFSVLAGLDGNQDGLVNNLDDGLADFNGDGIIDGTDQFGSLLIWRDINGDMVSQANELGTVGDHDITSFTLPDNDGIVDADGDGIGDILDTIHGSHVVGLSDFLRGDGTIGQVGEIFLDVDQMNTYYTGPEISEHAAVAALPDLKGFGQLTSFKKAMSYVADASDPPEQQAVQQAIIDNAAQAQTLIDGFDSNNILALRDAIKPLAQIWGNASPVGDDNGDITTGLNDRRDVVVLREFVPDSVINNQLSTLDTKSRMGFGRMNNVPERTEQIPELPDKRLGCGALIGYVALFFC